MKLDETRIVVTGAAGGMGRHFALALAEAGAQVAAWDIAEEPLAALASEAQGLAGEIEGFVVDVASEDSVIAGMQASWGHYGSLNALINNAGIFRDGLLVKRDKTSGQIKAMTLDQWQKVIDVDLTGPFLCTRELARRVVEHDVKPSVVVNISSVARYGNPGQSNYSAAKAGLVADTDLWAKELARSGVRFGAIAPGFVETPILEGMRPEVLQAMLKRVPLGRPGTAAEIFQGVRFIIECEYFTGRCIDIDGGLRM